MQDGSEILAKKAGEFPSYSWPQLAQQEEEEEREVGSVEKRGKERKSEKVTELSNFPDRRRTRRIEEKGVRVGGKKTSLCSPFPSSGLRKRRKKASELPLSPQNGTPFSSPFVKMTGRKRGERKLWDQRGGLLRARKKNPLLLSATGKLRAER